MSWLELSAGDPFGVHNLPLCGFTSGPRSAVGVRVGDRLLDLGAAEEAGLVDAAGSLRGAAGLNGFLARGRPVWTAVRTRIGQLLRDSRQRDRVEPLLVPVADVRLNLPFEVADYVDFYSSEQHASNVGQIFRPGQPPLPPNWKHLPIGYHGRSGTVVVSGTPIRRPCGQYKAPGAAVPEFGPTARLDFEAEVGFVVGGRTDLGQRIPPDRFRDHVFGVVLVNDWSARDIQAWEYQPLGPFLGKSFATSISPWVVPLDALDAAAVSAPDQDPPVPAYLREADRRGYDLSLEVRLNGTVISRPPFRLLYWSPAQQLAHLTVNGANVRPGDLFASGTVSGPDRDQTGSLLERTWGGTEPLTLGDGSTRTFLEDGDTVAISATAPGPGGTVVGFGAVTGTIQPAG